MYCSNCGAKVNEGAKFCPKCGNRVGQAPGGSGVRNAASPSAPSSPAPAPTPAFATTPAVPAEAQTPQPAPKRKSKVAIAIVAVVVAAAIAVLVLFLTGILSFGGPLATIPAGTYSLSAGNDLLDGMYFNEDGTMTFLSFMGRPRNYTFERVGTVGDGTVFALDDLSDSGQGDTTESGYLDATDYLLLLPNGFAKGDPVGTWAIQEVGNTHYTEFFVARDDGTAVYNGGYRDASALFTEDPQWWEEFFSNPEGGAGTWQRVGDGVYEIMLDGASSPGTIRLPS